MPNGMFVVVDMAESSIPLPNLCHSKRFPVEDGSKNRKLAIQTAITAAEKDRDRGDWLFVLYPYYHKHPKCSNDSSVRLYPLTTHV